MASRLSSLLVRDGLVTAKQIERAFQRQVLKGGSLDTVLLELGLIAEERLAQYLGLATGLPPATSADLADLDADAARACAEEVAFEHHVVPLGFADDALRVLTTEPVDLGVLERLADRLGNSLQPLIAPEFRFRAAGQRAYGGTLPERYASLVRSAAAAGQVAPVGHASSVVVEPNALRRRESLAPRPAPGPRPATTLQGMVAVAFPAATPAPIPTALAPAITRAPASPPAPASPTLPPVFAGAPPTGPSVQQTVGPALAPLTPEAARTALAGAAGRDAVFEILLRAIRDRVWYGGLLTVQGPLAVGRLALLGDEVDRAEIAGVSVRLDRPSPLARAVEDGAPYIGPIATGDAAFDRALAGLGGVLPPAALVLPIALRGRVVAVAVGHRGADTLQVAEVSDLLPLATLAGEALARIIVQRKGTSPATAPPPVAPPIADLAPAPPADRGARSPEGGPTVDAAGLFSPVAETRRRTAAALLSGPRAALERELAGLRAALLGDELPRAQLAAEAVAALGDVGAIPALLELHGRGGALVPAASEALVRLTAQDHGSATRKWRQWWDKHRSKHRVEWLLDGLGHRDPERRRAAIDDLRAMTGEYFGFHHDLGRREREEARQRWLVWWADAGRRKFR